MDLISPSEVTSKGNQYAFTVICMLTNNVLCIPLPDKTTNTVVDTYQYIVNWAESQNSARS